MFKNVIDVTYRLKSSKQKGRPYAGCYVLAEFANMEDSNVALREAVKKFGDERVYQSGHYVVIKERAIQGHPLVFHPNWDELAEWAKGFQRDL